LPHFLQIQLMALTSAKKTLQSSLFLSRLLVIVTFEGAMIPWLLESQIARKCTQKKVHPRADCKKVRPEKVRSSAVV